MDEKQLNQIVSFIPREVIEICKRFKAQDLECFIVGGAIRDLILGREVGDYDLATIATPDTVESMFDKTFDVGKEFGTITVVGPIYQAPAGKEPSLYQITTFRTETTYEQSRRPNDVTFIPSIQEDLSRRDFTMNAMALDPLIPAFIDPFDGFSDVQNHMIKAVGNPKERFQEDTLRIIRLFRFASVLEFEIDSECMEAVKTLSDSFPLPAMERVYDELSKLMASQKPHIGLQGMRDAGIFKRIFPSVPVPTDEQLALISAMSLDGRWALILKDGDYSKVLTTLRFPRKEAHWIKRVIRYNLDILRARLSPQDLNISSEKLMGLGFTGKDLGKVQQYLLDEIASNPEHNTQKKLLELASSFLPRGVT
ncbi:MAG: hypothetical protein HRT90_02015 [Candidatus Margulisbacteria bacterium]|nr:hypothetical protein [Candidatus Margulisiibacteriota bacterium]